VAAPLDLVEVGEAGVSPEAAVNPLARSTSETGMTTTSTLMSPLLLMLSVAASAVTGVVL
jgi:hypothetical protein